MHKLIIPFLSIFALVIIALGLGGVYFIQNELPISQKGIEMAFLIQKAKKGDVDAQMKVGLYYQKDLNDYKTAVSYFTLAALQGNAKAMKILSNLYLSGIVVPQDAAQAFSFLVKLADSGDAEAQGQVAKAYEKQKNYPAAQKYATLGAKQNDKLSNDVLSKISCESQKAKVDTSTRTYIDAEGYTVKEKTTVTTTDICPSL